MLTQQHTLKYMQQVELILLHFRTSKLTKSFNGKLYFVDAISNILQWLYPIFYDDSFVFPYMHNDSKTVNHTKSMSYKLIRDHIIRFYKLNLVIWQTVDWFIKHAF